MSGVMCSARLDVNSQDKERGKTTERKEKDKRESGEMEKRKTTEQKKSI